MFVSNCIFWTVYIPGVICEDDTITQYVMNMININISIDWIEYLLENFNL